MPDSTLVIPGTIDTHCHLRHLAAREFDVSRALSDWFAAGLAGIVDVGLVPADLDERRYIAQPGVAFSSGLHPSEIERPDVKEQLEILRNQAASGAIVAIGEIGLDYHWDTGTRSEAIAVFEQQAVIATEFDLPVIVHNREAGDDVLSVLRNVHPRGVMHCFSQDRGFCDACLELELFISFGGNLTFRKADDVRRAAEAVPDSRLLVETDSPYLSPEPVRGRLNHPGHLGFTVQFLADLRSQAAQTIASNTTENATDLFGIVPIH